METHHEGLDSVGGLVIGGVAMDGDEEVGMLVVGHLGTVVKRDEHVGFAGIEDIHIGTVFRDELSKFEGHREGDILLFSFAPHSAGVLAAVSGINHNPADTILRLRESLNVKKCKYRK